MKSLLPELLQLEELATMEFINPDFVDFPISQLQHEQLNKLLK